MNRVAGVRLPLLALVLAVATVWLSGCAPPRGAAPTARPNVVLLVVDTLRADHLGVYGYDRDTSPHLDRFARQNVIFTDARAQASCTFPSVNSLLTSRHPPAFLQTEKVYMGIPDGIPSLPEMLRAAGYATAAVSASPIVRRSPSRFNPDGGFGRGFDRFDESCVWQPAHCVNWAAAKTLAAIGHAIEPEPDSPTVPASPFFLYLHYMEPHDPYRPPTDFERRFSHHSADPTDGDPDVIAHRVYELEERVERHEIEPLVDRYDDEIAYFDQSFDELIRLLEGLDLMDSTVLVVASDHGEDFLEHGHVKHCRTLFDTSIRTPLILHMPGVRHRKVGVAVANLDVVATLLDLLRISSPEGLEGESLLAIAESDAYETRYVHSHQGRWRSVATSDAKIIADLVKSTVTYYDLRTDPGELTGTSDRAELPAELVRELRLRLDVEEQIVGRAGAVGAARRAAEHLRDLGYLE